jgi:cytoskeletal protein RodZ
VDKRLRVRKRFVLTLSVLLWIVVAIGLLSIVLWIEHIGSPEEKLSKPN